MVSILTQSLHRLVRNATRAILPNSCLLCGADSLDVVCEACCGDLPVLPPATCPQCAEPTAHGERCGRCLARPPNFDATIALYRYDFPLDRLVHALKYGSQLALAAWFAERLSQVLSMSGLEFDLALPLPLHTSRLRERGFNQSGEIAKHVARRSGLRLDLENCRRARPTRPQAELPMSDRDANVRGAFECSTDFSGRRILLIDDVMTTGATLDECARTLKLHGAVHVTAAVVGRALRQP